MRTWSGWTRSWRNCGRSSSSRLDMMWMRDVDDLSALFNLWIGGEERGTENMSKRESPEGKIE